MAMIFSEFRTTKTFLYANRISDEWLIQELQSIDREFRNKDLQGRKERYPFCLVRRIWKLRQGLEPLEGFSRLSSGGMLSYHPDSKAARRSRAVAYLAAAIACESP